MSISNPDHPNRVKIEPRLIIERAEVYPKRPLRNDLCFDIRWSEISDKLGGQPEKKFTVYLDKLHYLATEMFSVGDGYGLAGLNDMISDT